MRDHAACGTVELIPVPGLPEFRPGHDLVSAIATAAPWLRDGDVLVVTSKIFSKVEGRLVAAPRDPARREELRRELVESESVRVLARIRNTRITQNRLGIVQAASGVDASNVGLDEIALLPSDPDGSAASLRAALHRRLGVDVGVIVTDTMGRTWRMGQTDAAIGSAGVAVLHSYEGSVDSHGNTLVVTEIALADEIAAAADLVKGKLGGTGAAVLRGLEPRDDGSRAADLVRPVEEDLFSLGTAEAVAQGRREAVLLRRSVREFRPEPVAEETVRHAAAVALTAPAPHHTRPVRFVWLREQRRRAELLDAMREAWIADLVAGGMTEARATARSERGRLLYTAPELIVPFLVPEGAHSYPDDRRNAAEHTMFTVAAGAAVQGLLVALAADGVDSCWVGSTIFAPEVARSRLDLPSHWEPLGAIAAGYPTTDMPRSPRPPRELAEDLVEL